MTRVLVRKLLRDVRLPLLVVAVLLFGFSALWVKVAQRLTAEIAPFFQGVAKMSRVDKADLEAVLFRGPGKVSQAMFGGAETRFDEPTDLLAVGLLHPVVLILAALWAVGRSGAAVAGELDRGTMELLLSQPVPRGRLILAHLLVDAVTIPVLCLAVLAGTRFGLWAVGPFAVDYTALEAVMVKARLPAGLVPRGPAVLAVDPGGEPAAAVALGGLVFAISGLTLAVSAAGRSRWRAVGLAALVVLGMFSANVLGQLWEAAGWARPATLFFYYQPQKVWLRGDWGVELGEAWAGGRPLLNVPGAAVLYGAGLAGYLVAWRVFGRRDLPAPL